MSISPKILNRNEDKFTVFHMKIVNNSDENIEGYICYKVTMPNGKMDIKTFNRIERVNAHSELN